MPIGLPLLRNYINAASQIEVRKPAFSKNVSKDLSHTINNIMGVNKNGGEIAIMQKLSEAPESIFKPLISILTTPQKPTSLEQLRAFRRNLYLICKKNPEARAYIESLTQFLNENKEAGNLINRIGKGIGNYINVFINSKSFKKGLGGKTREDYKSATNAIMEKLNSDNLNTHLQNFFKYITNNK